MTAKTKTLAKATGGLNQTGAQANARPGGNPQAGQA